MKEGKRRALIVHSHRLLFNVLAVLLYMKHGDPMFQESWGTAIENTADLLFVSICL